MTAVTFGNLYHCTVEPGFYYIAPNAKIHPTVRLEPFCVIDEDVEIGANSIVGPYVQMRNGTRIGAGCRIGGHSTFEGLCTVGNDVRMGTHCNVGWGCDIEDLVFIGGHFTGGNDKKMMWKRGEAQIQGYRIERAARIGLHCTIGPGVLIGENALVGMHSVVTRSIPPGEIWYGVPARKHGEIKKEEWL